MQSMRAQGVCHFKKEKEKKGRKKGDRHLELLAHSHTNIITIWDESYKTFQMYFVSEDHLIYALCRF